MNIFNCRTVLLAAGVLAMAGCSLTVVETGADSPALADDAVVIGKLRVVRNGTDVGLGRGFFASRATVDLIDLDTADHFEADVGENGEFAWTLAEGSYTLESIDFMVRGERVSLTGDFAFDVGRACPATYIGTITVETTFDSGYYGLTGAIDGYSITDDCEADCAPMLTRLGVAADAATVALLRPAGRRVSRK